MNKLNFKNESIRINGVEYSFKEFEKELYKFDKTENKGTFDIWKLKNKEENNKKWVYYKVHLHNKSIDNTQPDFTSKAIAWGILTFVIGILYFAITN